MPKKKEKAPGKRPILVPIDFSPNSESVLEWAADATCVGALKEHSEGKLTAKVRQQ